jgi:uncharacterized protein (TIRG00374 family)
MGDRSDPFPDEARSDLPLSGQDNDPSHEAGTATSLAWRSVVKRVIFVVVSGLAIYLVLPRITDVLASFPRLSTLNWVWFAIAIAAQAAHFGCDFALQRLALRTRGWFAVITAQLAGNAITNVLPAGSAAGAAVQYRMLATSGIATDTAVGGLTAFSLLGIGGLLALPIFTLPAILFGAPVRSGLAEAAYVGIGGFVLFTGLGVFVLATDRPLAWFGRFLERVRNAIVRRRPPLTGLDDRLVRERDTIRSVLGQKWREAVFLSAGRLGFDFFCLLAALRATGSHPRPSLVLVAFAVSGVIGLVPLTPGGLGIIEASMSALLVLAGVSVGHALLATLTYRLAQYWLPLLAGPIAYAAFRRRYQTNATAR